MLKLSPIQKRLIGLWLTIARALRVPRHVEGGICWALGLPPMAGASDQGGSAGGAGGGGEGGGSGGGEGGAGEGGSGGEGGGSGGGSGSGGEGGEGGAGWTPPTKAEWDNIQRQQRESAKTLKELQDAEAERKRKADEDAGNFQAIAEREREAREKAERERDEERQKNEESERNGRVTSIASRLNFRDAGDVLHRLSDEDKSTDAKAEKALKTLAKEKPYLIKDGETQRQRDLGDGDGGSGGSETEPTGVDRMARAYSQSSGS